MERRHLVLVLVFILVSVTAGAALSCRDGQGLVVYAGDFGPGIATVSGRLDDPDGVRTSDTVLSIMKQTENGGYGIYRRIAADGTFTTPPVPAGTYWLEIIRTPHSHTNPPTALGVGRVEVRDTDLTGVVVRIYKDMELPGRYRVASDRADPQWPTSIHVSAPLIIDGREWLSSTQVAHGAEGGRFVLRNAFGPRVLRASYWPAKGQIAGPARVLLDGRDITDIPTDFSEHVGSDLEVVITERPTRLVGTVKTASGRPAAGVTVVMFSADPRKRFGWASTSHVATTNDAGVFSIAALPGSYLIQTAPRGMDATAALREIPMPGRDAVPVELGENGTPRVTLTLTR